MSNPPAACAQPVACGRSAPEPAKPAWISLAPRAPSVSVGRRFARTKLARYDAAEFVDDVELVVSELITNAYRALIASRCRALGVISLGVQCTDRWVHLCVQDTCHTMPALRDATEGDEHGRGLRIVDALATLWVEPNGSPGKAVHALLAAPGVVLTQDDLDWVVGVL